MERSFCTKVTSNLHATLVKKNTFLWVFLMFLKSTILSFFGLCHTYSYIICYISRIALSCHLRGQIFFPIFFYLSRPRP